MMQLEIEETGKMQPSKYQQAIIEWAQNSTGNATCHGVAGSGKTATIRMVVQALSTSGLDPYDIKVIVFGKANADQLISRFGPQWKKSISTLHSAGWSLVRSHLSIKNSRGLVDRDKYKTLSKELGFIYRGQLTEPLDKAITSSELFLKLIHLVRLTNVEPNEEKIKMIYNHFDLDGAIFDLSQVAQALDLVLKEGERVAHNKISFDFTDMVWLPVRWRLSFDRFWRPYQFVLVDECQDLNVTQLELSCMLAGNLGRMLFVGDPRQAIMGFAGADSDSYQRILKRVEGTELPLSICYRCPRSHISLVKRNFPDIPIEPAPNSNDGQIKIISEMQLRKTELTHEDLIISRKTAPLVSLCIRLIADGVAATVKGREIGESLKKLLQGVSKLSFPFSKFGEALELYFTTQKERYANLSNAEGLTLLLKDRVAAISAIYRALPQAKSIFELESYIDNLFSDNKNGVVTLCTCHRAKGLEAERVFLYKPDDMPMTWRTIKPWQAEQEDNLLYVALTRSKSELYIVGEPDWLTREKETQSDRTLSLQEETRMLAS